jgi:YebC/PmpR family DNA-binding regulatory protein
MSGHSKFANIKHKKEKNDAARGKVYTKLGREIAVAVKAGGPDPLSNNKLRDIISKAKANNMPNDNIERSIKKASGDLNSVNYENITYEGYGPNGIAVIVSSLTDNKNRTAANVRSFFTKGGGNLGTTGCVSFMFDEKGIIMVEKDDTIDEDDLLVLSLESGASDFVTQDEGYEIETDPFLLYEVVSNLEKNKIKLLSSEVTMVPQVYVSLTNELDIKKMTKLLDLLEEDDDVQDVWHNWEY